MVDIADIKDRASLRAWLKDRPRTDAVMIAHRAAMRVAPIYWQAVPIETSEGDLTELPVLRSCLISEVAGNWPKSEIRSAATDAVAVDALAPGIFALVSAALFALTAAAFADAADAAAEDAAFALGATDAPNMWKAVRADCAALVNDGRMVTRPLWQDATSPLDKIWQAVRQDWSQRGPGWRFWIGWYDDALAGRLPSEKLLTKVALIDPADWIKGIDHVNGLIAELVERHSATGPADDLLQNRVLAAALADFSFDGMRRLLEMVPFDDDIRHLRDDTRQRDFLDDAQELVDGLEDFTKAMGASTRHQGAPGLQTYIDSVLSELSRVRQLEHLRVRRLLNLGAVLQDFSLEDGCRMGLGDVLAKELDRLVATMLDLTRSHFAPSILRLKPLDDLVLTPGDVPRDIIEKLQTNLDAVRRVKSGFAVPLNDDDLAVLGDMIGELARLARAIENTEVIASRKDLESQFARKAGQLGVTFGRYWIIARDRAGSLSDATDKVLQQFKKVKNLTALLEWVHELWDKMPWN